MHKSPSIPVVKELTPIRTSVRRCPERIFRRVTRSLRTRLRKKAPQTRTYPSGKRPTPCHRSAGTSEARHSASQASRGERPAEMACSAVRPSSSVSARSAATMRPYGPNSASRAMRNSLNRTEGLPARERNRDAPARLGTRVDTIDTEVQTRDARLKRGGHPNTIHGDGMGDNDRGRISE